MSFRDRQHDVNVNPAGGAAGPSVTHPVHFGADPGLLVLRLAIDYLQEAQACGANVHTEAARVQQLLAGLGAV